MNPFLLAHRFHRLKVPGLVLVTLLQRAPALRIASADAGVLMSPVAQALRSLFAAAAALGGMHSLAGATPLVASPAPATGTTTTVGGSVNVAFTVTGTQTPPASWSINGIVPPGLSFSGLTGSGVVNVRVLQLTGVATAAGTYPVEIITYEGVNATLVPSPTYTYTITVAGGPPSVGGAPTFTLQPTSVTVASGATAVLNASATNATSYRWRKDGSDVAGATGPALVLANVGAAAAGTYSVVASNGGATTTSNSAILTVAAVSAADAGRLGNLSVRTSSGTGDQVLNVGFAIGRGTSAAKPLLVRAAGPALVAFGVPGAMTDPTLTIQPLGQSTIVASNDNWAGDPAVESSSRAVGAFPLDAASRDAAVLASLSAGTYTALAAGRNNGTGIVLTEIYDATPSGSFTAATPRLINVSARAQVGTGDGVLIAGFVVAGTTAKTLLIRATGPALAAFGVPGTIADPKLEVALLGGAKLYENDNWGGSATLASTAASVGAFAINDASSKDAVLLVTLPPGVYTAQVSGVNNGTGIALVEVYDVP